MEREERKISTEGKLTWFFGSRIYRKRQMMTTAVEIGNTIAVIQGGDVKQRSEKQWRSAIQLQSGTSKTV
jgi:hypothetical protein